jgi:hypothetical protein
LNVELKICLKNHSLTFRADTIENTYNFFEESVCKALFFLLNSWLLTYRETNNHVIHSRTKNQRASLSL